jgi:hypothetical protein
MPPKPPMPSRPSLLVAAGGLLLAGPATACSGDDEQSGRRPSGAAGSSATRGPRLASGRFRSDAMGGRSIGWTVCLPPGVRAAGLPVCVVLHGRGDTHRAAFTFVGFVRLVDGRLRGSAARRAARVRPGAAVAVDSPAPWLHAGESAAGAFDDAADFARNDVFARVDRLARIPVRVVVGRRDPFLTATREFVTGVPDLAAAVIRDGGHDAVFWRATAPAQLAFVAAALNR